MRRAEDNKSRVRVGEAELRRVSFAIVLLCLGAYFFATTAVWAQSNAFVRGIKIEGNQRIEVETIRSYMILRVGDPLTRAAVDRALKSLFNTGLFADVSIDVEDATVVVRVRENPIINRINFEGNRRLEDKDLKSEVTLRPRVVYTRRRVQSDVERVLQLYRRLGRFSASVEPKIVSLSQNRVDLIFEINEGPDTVVGKIDFVGNRAFDDADLKDEVLTEESRWYRFLTDNDKYDPDRLERDRELLRRFYLSKGYADFRVISAIAELAKDQSSFFVTFTIEEGELYTFGKVAQTTTLPKLDPATLSPQVTTLEGEIYNADEVEKTILNLTVEVGRLGFAFVRIRPNLDKDRKARIINIVFAIEEGPKAYIERINISGNVRTLDEVIRRRFVIAEGDAFNTAKLRESRRRVRGLGFFEKVGLKRRRGDTPEKVEVDVEVEERSTGELSIGFGFSTSEEVLADVAIRERNLLGRGQDLKVEFAASSVRQQIDLAFTEPYFLDRDLAAGFDIFLIDLNEEDRSSFEEQIVGGRLRTNFPLLRNWRGGVSYTLRENEITDITTSTSPLIRGDAGTFVTSEIGYYVRYDTRDSILLPSEGFAARIDQGIAGFGGDVRFIRTTARLRYYHPLAEDIVGTFGLRAGHIEGLDQNIRVSERFFVGGSDFRGFERGGVGARDISTDDSLGNNTYYVGSVEVRFPIGFSDELRIYGHAFSEFGSAFDIDVAGANLRDSSSIRATAGIGISWASPIGPMRVDLTEVITKQSYDKGEFFRFSVGTRF